MIVIKNIVRAYSVELQGLTIRNQLHAMVWVTRQEVEVLMSIRFFYIQVSLTSRK